MSDGPTIRYAVLVYLRGAEDPIIIPRVSRRDAVQTIGYVAHTWLRLPPEARPASCWIVTHEHAVTEVTEAGVGERPEVELLAAIDPREIQAVQLHAYSARTRKAKA